MLRVARSVPSEDAIAQIVHSDYGLRVRDCVLLRSLVNDVYRVDTDTGRYAFKLYRHRGSASGGPPPRRRPGGWSHADLIWQHELVECLVAQRIAVTPVIRRPNGEHCGIVPAAEGARGYALTRYIDGRPPEYTAATYREFGALLAAFHTAAETMPNRHDRRADPLDDLDDTVADLCAALPEYGYCADDLRTLRDLAALARGRLTGLSDSIRFGVRHADVTLDNLVRTEGGLVLYDFDSSGAGPCAADLTGVTATEYAQDFLAGYTAHRRLEPGDLESVRWHAILGLIANLWFHVVDKPRWRGRGSVGAGWADSIWAELRTAAERHL